MDLLIHIGLHKTGSTALQASLFSRQAGLGFCSELIFDGATRQSSFFQRLLTYDSKGNLRSPFDDAQSAVSALKSAADKLSTGIPVLSHERLSGDPHGSAIDSLAICERLAACCKHPKVLIVLRRQSGAAYSNYIQYLRSGGVASPRRYVSGPNYGGFNSLNINYYKYHFLVSAYIAKFGKDNVLVLPYEMLFSEKDLFFSKIQNFCSLEHQLDVKMGISNSSDDGVAQIYLRHLNLVCHRTEFGYCKPVVVSKKLDFIKRGLIRSASKLLPRWIAKKNRQDFEAQFNSLYSQEIEASNTLLQGLVSFNLEKYGYHD